MLRRIGSFNDHSCMAGICHLRAKFNDALNDAIAKVDQYIMTINSCNTYDHFDRQGNLTSKGKTCFWWEVDDLIERFKMDKVKLLPNPKNPSKKVVKSSRCRKMPTPPPMKKNHKDYYRYY